MIVGPWWASPFVAPAPKVGRPKRDRGKIKAGRKAARRQKG